MRSDIQEPGRGFLTAASKASRLKPTSLQASAVDAALDDLAPVAMPINARRDAAAINTGADAGRVSIDVAHGAVEASTHEAGDGRLLRQLSRQLSMLEIQQQQIRRLLEQTEQRASRAGTRIDR